MLFIVEKIWVDTYLSIGGSLTGHNLVVSLINSLYLAGLTRSSKALDWTSDPTDDFDIIDLASFMGRRFAIKLFLQQRVTLFILEQWMLKCSIKYPKISL